MVIAPPRRRLARDVLRSVTCGVHSPRHVESRRPREMNASATCTRGSEGGEPVRGAVGHRVGGGQPPATSETNSHRRERASSAGTRA